MKFSNRTKLYFNIVLLCLFCGNLFLKIKEGYFSSEPSYFRILISVLAIFFAINQIYQVSKLNKTNNDKSN